MPLQKGYAVIRFQVQGGESYEVMDYKQGELLYQLCMNQEYFDKEEFIHLICLFTVGVDGLCRERGRQTFFPVTPYNTLLTKEGQIAFLEPEEETNREIIRTIKRDPACRKFWRQEDLKNSDNKLSYIYGYGKTLQYLLAHVKTCPKLTFQEERCFLHIIQSCINRASGFEAPDFKHILKKIPKGTKPKKKSVFYITAAGVVILLCIFLVIPKEAKETRAAPQPEKKQVKSTNGETERSYKALGRACFLKEEYGKSRKYFAELPEDKEAVCFRILSEHMMGMDTGENIQDCILEAEKMQQTDNRALFDLSLFRIQRTLDGEPAWSETVRLGEKVAGELGMIKKEEQSAIMAELYEGLAEVYERCEEPEKEMEAYKKLLEAKPKRALEESAYLKLPDLYAQSGNIEEALAVAGQAVEAMPYSISVRIQFLRYQCKSGASKEQIAEIISQALKEIPELTERVTFQKLLKEFSIKIEGESVWVEE